MEMENQLTSLIEELAVEFAEMPVTFLARAVGECAGRLTPSDHSSLSATLRHDLEALRGMWSSE